MLRKEERETVLLLDEMTSTWIAETSMRRMMTKFDNAGWECIKEIKDKKGNVETKRYKAPENYITVRSIRKKNKEA